jgi:hypothetical protein
LEYYIFKVEFKGKQTNCISILPSDFVLKNSSGKRAIVGYLEKEDVDQDEFTENTAFKEFIHKTIANELPKETEFLNQGKKVNSGYMYVIDKRTKKPKGDIPFQDIIGAMNFENSLPVPDSYIPNNNYKLLTKDGLFQLPFSLEEKLLIELNK